MGPLYHELSKESEMESCLNHSVVSYFTLCLERNDLIDSYFQYFIRLSLHDD